MPKVIQYRQKCIGCGICFEMQPEIWRMSRKDGKAILIKATVKKEIHMVDIPEQQIELSEAVAIACPVNIIKVG